MDKRLFLFTFASMKRTLVFAALLCGFVLSVFCGKASAQALPSLWVYEKSEAQVLDSLWNGHVMPATYFGAGVLTADRLDKSKGEPSFAFAGAPALSPMVEDDYFLFSFPVQHVDAGSYIEFDFSLQTQPGAPKYFVVEYLDGSEWKSMPYDLMDIEEDPSLKCSFVATGDDDTKKAQTSTVLQTIRLENEINEGEVQLRVRAVGPYTCNGEAQGSDSARVRFVRADNTACYAQLLGTKAPCDTTNVLCIGNSFTYVAGASWLLKEIAWSQGHYLDVEVSLKGGQTFGQHLELSQTDYALEFGDFDYVFLQDQSQNPARYAENHKQHGEVVENCVCLACRIRELSPDAKVYVESTWSYPGHENGGFPSLRKFDNYMTKGAKKMAKECHADVSPIGKAFALSRALRPDIPLYAADDKHQSEYGAYLKACVNYLLMFREPFNDEVPSCALDLEKAAFLRAVAAKTVL